jgi:Tol biopolymer transport system component
MRLTRPDTGQADLPGDFSPDGSDFLFRRAQNEEDGQLMEIGVEGSRPTAVTESLVEDPGRYSPDGRTILTSSMGHLLLLDRDGNVLTEVAEDGAYLFGAVWSPDGSRIAFSRATSGHHADVYTAMPDGTDRRQVTATEANEIRVEWGPS